MTFGMLGRFRCRRFYRRGRWHTFCTRYDGYDRRGRYDRY